MKQKLYLLLLIAGCVLPLLGMVKVDTNKHIGTWSHTDDGVTSSFVFQKNGFAKIITGKDTIGGESYRIDGEEYSLKYSANYTKNPHYITLTMYFKNSNIRVSSMKGIFKFNAEGKMVLCLDFEEGPRPTNFVEEDTVTLTKSE